MCVIEISVPFEIIKQRLISRNREGKSEIEKGCRVRTK